MSVMQYTVLEQGELIPGRGVRGYFRKVTVSDGKVLGVEGSHAVLVMPGDDVEAAIADINQHLTTQKNPWPPIRQEDIDAFVGVCRVLHTPEIVAAYQALKASREAAFQAPQP